MPRSHGNIDRRLWADMLYVHWYGALYIGTGNATGSINVANNTSWDSHPRILKKYTPGLECVSVCPCAINNADRCSCVRVSVFTVIGITYTLHIELHINYMSNTLFNKFVGRNYTIQLTIWIDCQNRIKYHSFVLKHETLLIYEGMYDYLFIIYVTVTRLISHTSLRSLSKKSTTKNKPKTKTNKKTYSPLR